jgi:HSP20 family molecular chaperone IbpA
MDLVETEDHFVLKADLPGLAEGEVNVEGRGQRAHPLR